MLPRLLCCFAPLLLALALGTPTAPAQAPANTAPAKAPAPATTPAAQPAGDTEKTERSPALPYAVVLVYTLLVLVIVCMPSRKA